MLIDTYPKWGPKPGIHGWNNPRFTDMTPEDWHTHNSNTQAAHFGINGETKEQCMSILPKLTSLRYLMFKGYIKDDAFEEVCKLSTLEILTIQEFRGMSLTPLAQLQNLMNLDLVCNRDLSFAPISALGKLEVLALGIGDRVTSLSSLKFENLNKLKVFVLENSGMSTKISLKSISSIGKLKSLEHLVLGKMRVEDKRLDFFQDLPNLKSITMLGKDWNKSHVESLIQSHIEVCLLERKPWLQNN